MNLGFVTSDFSRRVPVMGSEPEPGGAGWYRIVMPARRLAAAGHHVVVGHSVGSDQDTGEIRLVDWFGEEHDGLDIIVMQRWMHEEAADVIRRARAYGQTVINDIDDWFWGIPTTNSAFASSHVKTNSEVNVAHYKAALGASSLVTTSTPYLAERLRGMTRAPVVVLRNAIDLAMFDRPRLYSDIPVVGWVGATTHRSGDLEILRGILGPFVKRHHLRLFHGGAMEGFPAFSDMAGVPEALVQEVAMLSISRYPAFFDHFDIGLVPLSDVPFNKAKSAIKGMEYAASGIPFVASATPEYEWFGQGIVCRRPKDWIRALERLMDPDERVLVAKRAKERVASEDIALRWADWEKVYSEAEGS